MAADPTAAAVGAVLGILGVLFVAWATYNSIIIVREKQAVVLERLGRFHSQLGPGLHFVLPFIDRPKKYSWRYYLNDHHGNIILVEKLNQSKIETSDQILDLPKQQCITKDNAQIYLDALLNYKITNPKLMVYSTQNLPRVMSLLLQAQIRNVAGSLDVDSVIEETASMDRVAADLGAVASRWGVTVSFVKFQRVDAGTLTDVLAKRKNAQLENESVIIRAKAAKQKAVIESEGNRDRMMKEAEGEAQQIRSRARGEAKAIENAAAAEAESVREVAHAIVRSGENPTRYLLASRYMTALQSVLSLPGTSVSFVPTQTATVQSLQSFGVQPALVTQPGSGAGLGGR